MLYTFTAPEYATDRVHLYPHVEAAIADAHGGPLVYRAAVDFDVMCHLLVPGWVDPQVFEPTWTTPAELHGDSSVTAKGTIPKELFVAFACTRR